MPPGNQRSRRCSRPEVTPKGADAPARHPHPLRSGVETLNGDARCAYAKLGLIRDLLAIGSTAVSIGLYEGRDFESAGGRLRSWAVAAVQNWNAASLELVVTYRISAYRNATPTRFSGGQALLTGLRWRF